MRKLAMPVAAIGLAAAALTGCGGGEEHINAGEAASASTTASASAAITKAQFLERANAICTAGNTELASSAATLDPASTTEEQFVTFVRQTLIPNVRGQVSDIRALGYPKGDEMTVESMLAEAEQRFTEIEADPMILRGTADPFRELNTRLKDYGLTACAE
ncbi:MAG: hypothetical protein L0Y54_20720 [Sporichthyaceae bacterium]|nr:hypothetical protein [Sporichthyaceae bacterium]